MDHKKYLAMIGRKGGQAGRGAAKVRGDAEYYRKIQKLGIEARKKKKLQSGTSGTNIIGLLW